MATLNAVIVPAKVLKGGRHKVRISVAHNGETRYIVTDITIDSLKEFKNGAIVKRSDAALLNTKLRGLLQRYQSVVDGLVYVNGLNCAELVFQIKNAGNYEHRTLGSIVEEYFANARIKPSTLNGYHTIWRRVSRHLDGKTLVENINYATIMSLRQYLFSINLMPMTVRNSLVFVMVLLNYAKRCGYVQYRVDPFAGIELPKMEPRQSWLSVDEVKTIRDVKLTTATTIKARDFFMLSYYLGGINMIDLCQINFNEQTKIIHYVRQKTENRPKLNKFVEFVIPDEAKAIIAKYKQPDGLLAMTAAQRRESLHSLLQAQIPKIAAITGIRQLVFYSARKSFSQHAFKLGVSESVIDYILGHRVDKGSTALFSYISVTPEMATKAVRKVLDNLR
ncbi:MAG: hypothetical protein NC214_08435 [Candidatus Amulumruptor caecigallinarius]|nr:hypothetical protein [Candidatus Amulumruptor caecigallinarius]MCM1454312.1 hypothetical protein [bacterium]